MFFVVRYPAALFALAFALTALTGCDTTGVAPVADPGEGNSTPPVAAPDSLPPVANLAANVDGQDVHLTWTPPATNALRAIEIYRFSAVANTPDSFDDVEPDAALSPTASAFHDPLPESSLYVYYVVTRFHGMDGYGESAIAVAPN